MNISTLEQRHDVQQAAQVLAALAHAGLREPAIAADWTRRLVAGGSTSDINASYVGDIPYSEAQDILQHTLNRLRPDTRDMWDVRGIWNAQQAYDVTRAVDDFLLYYLNSIDSLYLGADGRLHDPTGHGFDDADTKTLRINEYDHKNGRTPTASEEVNVCLENCRRIAKFG